MKELTVWSKFKHPNILPLLGYYVIDNYPHFVSEWMENGTIRTYVKQDKLSIKELLPIVSISANFFKSSTNLISYWELRTDSNTFMTTELYSRI